MGLNLNEKFDKKIKELDKNLPSMTASVNCAELTLTSVLEVLGIDNYMFHNIAKPLAGGFGGYKSKKGWMGACGAVTGGCAAIGAIIGGKSLMNDEMMGLAYYKAAKYCSEFENQFGTVVCSELCAYDFSEQDQYMKYRENGIWGKTCYKFVVWGVNKIKELTQEDLQEKWE
ncbi:MAG: C-GCAxxG-C-C family protein [Promethearchaeota archaeon]